MDTHLLIIKDELPFFDVVQICTLARSAKIMKHSRILVMSSNKEESFQVAPMEAGADDILFIQVSPNVLFSKGSMLLRRKGSAE